MKTQIFKSDSRGKASYGWLNATYSFSFAHYDNPDRVNFGALRVWNDDIVQPSRGFDTHPHDNMEIITIPLAGAVLHKDSMGHESIIKPNEVQVMSAGSGIFHSEYNASPTEPLNLFQIWIFPNVRNIKPTYNQTEFDDAGALNQWQNLVSPVGNEGLTIHQNAWINRTKLEAKKEITYKMQPGSYGSFLMVVEGEVAINDTILSKRDSMGITDTDEFTLTALEDSYLINIEVPDYK